jgi:hypothetical protein
LLGAGELEPRVNRPLLQPRDDGDEWPEWPIRSAEDAQTVAARVATLVRDQAFTFAAEHATLEAMLEWFEQDDGPQRYQRLALLGAAGRFDDARAGLESFDPADFPNGSDPDGGERFVRQLRRWIDSGGDPRLRTAAPPPPRHDNPADSAGAIWNRARDEHHAVQAVRRQADHLSRDELREQLISELAQRDLRKNPVWIEQTLDTMSLSRPEQWQRTSEMLGRLGAGLMRAARDRRLPDLSVPERLAPPVRAVYAVPRHPNHLRIAVDLDPEAGGWLDEVYAALPKVLDTPVDFDAWLRDDGANDGRLTVNIGAHRVGRLDERSTASFVPVMRAAAQRDELPYTAAALRRLDPGGYLLEVQLPAPAVDEDPPSARS